MAQLEREKSLPNLYLTQWMKNPSEILKKCLAQEGIIFTGSIHTDKSPFHASHNHFSLIKVY